MQAGTLVTSDVMAYTSRVLVNGVQRPALSWSVDRELSGDLPAQVVAASGLTQATGNVEWATEADLHDGAVNPWNKSTGWIPAKGDRVEIYAGDSVTEWKQFHGVIGRTTGSIGNGFQSTLIDDYDKLSVEVSHLPLLRIMPPAVAGGPYRGIGLNSSYFADFALRAAGFYVTPKREANAALSVPAQGSMWPEAGTMLTGAPFDGVGSHQSLHGAPWGWSVSNFLYTYSPGATRPASDPIQISMMVAPDSAGFTTVRAVFGTSHLQLSISGAGLVTANVNGTNILSFTLTGGGIIQVLVKNEVATLRSSNGQSVTIPVSFARATVMGEIQVSGSALTRVAGIQVSHPTLASLEFAALSHIGSARLDFSDTTLSGIMDASRTIENTTAGDLLQEISEATLTGMWIDELGVMQWASSPGLRKRASVRTVTTLNDILSLDWEDSLLGARSKVTVSGFSPAISVGRTCSRLVWRGSGDEIGSGEIVEDIAEPEGDVEWVQPDTTLTVIGTGSWATYNARNESLAGVFYTSSGETISSAGLNTSIAMARLNLRQLKIRHVAGTFPADVTAVLGTSPTDPALWTRNRDVNLPVIRTFGKSQWPEVRVTPVAAGGVGPELVHEAGVWTNESTGTDRLDRLATFIAGQTSVPKPTITGLEITYDPRLQLGDVIKIYSPDLMGVSITALIVGISNSAGGSFTQSLSVRIVTATSTFQTFEEFNASMPGSKVTFQQWDALGPKPQTFAGFNTNI